MHDGAIALAMSPGRNARPSAPSPRTDVASCGEPWTIRGEPTRLALTPEHMEDFAGMAGLEFLLIDEKTDLRQFRNELRWNDAAYGR